MKRITQNLSELEDQLSKVESDWKDQHIRDVETLFAVVDQNPDTRICLRILLDAHFDAAKTLIRSFLALSKDEFELNLRTELGGSGIKTYQRDPEVFIQYLMDYGVTQEIFELTSRTFTWQDIIFERLRSGRGSAIKGQKRGRGFEDKIESIVMSVFGQNGFDTRCRFVGVVPKSTEKADFAIPNRNVPSILIEAKAYGATGSKQTDIIGDVTRIVKEKRRDTTFLLVTDGNTWKSRLSDLRKLVELQQSGDIYRIYTQKMFGNLESDLRQLKNELGL